MVSTILYGLFVYQNRFNPDLYMDEMALRQTKNSMVATMFTSIVFIRKQIQSRKTCTGSMGSGKGRQEIENMTVSV